MLCTYSSSWLGKGCMHTCLHAWYTHTRVATHSRTLVDFHHCDCPGIPLHTRRRGRARTGRGSPAAIYTRLVPIPKTTQALPLSLGRRRTYYSRYIHRICLVTVLCTRDQDGRRALLHGSPVGLRLRHPRQHHILPGVPRTHADVPAGVPEEVDGGVQRGAVRGGALQLHAVDLLRAGQDQLQPAAHHQRLRLRRRGLLHPALRGVRAQARQAPRPRLLPPPRRRRLRPHRRRHRLPRAPAQPRQGPRQRLPRLLHGRLRRTAQRHLRGDQDQERRVHALLALLLPNPQRRRLVLLRPLHQGHLRNPPERGRLLLRRGPDDALLLLPQAGHVGPGPADGDPRRVHGGGGAAGGGAAGGHPPGGGHADGEYAADAGGAAEDGAGDQLAHPAQGLHQGFLIRSTTRARMQENDLLTDDRPTQILLRTIVTSCLDSSRSFNLVRFY